MKAYVYLRVSGAGQVEGDGFRRQYLACEAYAAQRGIEIVKTYREEGVSGTKELDDRPALQSLFVDLEDNDVKVVLIEKLDRLARDLMVQETLIADMQKRGYELLSTAEPDLCSSDPSRVLVRQIFGCIAEYEKSVIVLRLRGARQRHKISHGRCEGRKPYGANEDERPTLDWMQRMRADGMTYLQIAQALNFVDKRARNGGEWKAATVGKILIRFVPGQQITSQLQKHDVQVVENVELSPAL